MNIKQLFGTGFELVLVGVFVIMLASPYKTSTERECFKPAGCFPHRTVGGGTR